MDREAVFNAPAFVPRRPCRPAGPQFASTRDGLIAHLTRIANWHRSQRRTGGCHPDFYTICDEHIARYEAWIKFVKEAP